MSEFREIATLEEIAEGCVRCYVLDGRRLALIRIADAVFAIDDRCPHRGGPLSEGTVEDGTLVCPWHFWRFDPARGRHEGGSKFAVATHEVRVEDGRIFVRLSTGVDTPG
jgi:nitrite reductase (NADH) small subunit